MKKTQICIIGGGIAGLTAAYFLSQKFEVLVLDSGAGDKQKMMNASQMAQGGIAATENWKSHMEDTLKAGHYKNNQSIVEILCKEAWAALAFLQDNIGVKFSSKPAQEGGHSERRVWTTGDDTGAHIYWALFEKCKQQKNIIWQHSVRVQSVEKNNESFILGFYENDNWKNIQTNQLIFATGGIGGLFQYSTNPPSLKGDGLLFANQLGAELKDLDVVQFHPTGLLVDKSPVPLLTEALRGEGALLVNEHGERFLDLIEGKELAARDIVVAEMLKQQKCFLDLREISTGKSKLFWEQHFPNICKQLENFQFNIEKDLIPVIPTEHFLCGGIVVDEWSESRIENVFAVGECSCTGAHGQNRLASNSLLESVVFGKRCALKIIERVACANLNQEINAHKSELKALPFASVTELQSIQKCIQIYFQEYKKNKIVLKQSLLTLPKTIERETALLFC